MFRNVIDSTPFTTKAADNLFSNITGSFYNRDTTFLSTLRALVAPRMQKSELLSLKFNESYYKKSDISGYDKKTIINAICNRYIIQHGTICVHNLKGPTQQDNQACLDILESGLESEYTGWRHINKVKEFFRKTMNTLCFINQEKKSVIVFVDNMDMRKMHYLQCSIFALFPWYFDPAKGVSDGEMELINSLSEKSATKYKDCIAKIAETYDIRAENIRLSLKGLEAKYERAECNRIRSIIQSIDRNINDYNDAISNYLNKRRNEEYRLLGLTTKIAQINDDSEIMNYFIRNNKLILESVSDTSIVFSVKDYLTYYDENIAKNIIDNPRSYIYIPDYEEHEDLISCEDMKKLMYEIFINQKLKMKFCATYQFDLGVKISPLSDQNYGYEFRDCTPNPHINKYSCMGSYINTINNMIKDNNYIGAIEQCIASCKSLNFADSAVMEYFMSTIYELDGYKNVNICCIELPDGSIATPKDAIKWINSQEVNNNEQVNQNDT